jgi:hypothetical protein
MRKRITNFFATGALLVTIFTCFTMQPLEAKTLQVIEENPGYNNRRQVYCDANFVVIGCRPEIKRLCFGMSC